MITFADSEEEDLLIAGAYPQSSVLFAEWFQLSNWHGVALIVVGAALMLATLSVR